MKVRHETVGGYTITTTYHVGLVHHEQVDEYDKDGEWISSSTTMGEYCNAEAGDVPPTEKEMHLIDQMNDYYEGLHGRGKWFRY